MTAPSGAPGPPPSVVQVTVEHAKALAWIVGVALWLFVLAFAAASLIIGLL